VNSGNAVEEDTLGEGPVQHFTNAEGVQGITGINPDDLEIGQTVRVPMLSFGQGSNHFLAGEDGDIFVTEIGPHAASGQLNQIGVFGDKQNYVIQFSRESTFANNSRLNPLFPSRSIFSIAKGTTLGASAYIYTVTRLR